MAETLHEAAQREAARQEIGRLFEGNVLMECGVNAVRRKFGAELSRLFKPEVVEVVFGDHSCAVDYRRQVITQGHDGDLREPVKISVDEHFSVGLTPYRRYVTHEPTRYVPIFAVSGGAVGGLRVDYPVGDRPHALTVAMFAWAARDIFLSPEVIDKLQKSIPTQLQTFSLEMLARMSGGTSGSDFDPSVLDQFVREGMQMGIAAGDGNSYLQVSLRPSRGTGEVHAQLDQKITDNFGNIWSRQTDV